MEIVFNVTLTRLPLRSLLPRVFPRRSVLVLLEVLLVDLPRHTLPTRRIGMGSLTQLHARRSPCLPLARLDVLMLARRMVLRGLHRRLHLTIRLRFLLTLGTRTSYTSPGFPSLTRGVWCRRTPARWSTVLTLQIRLPSFLLRESRLPGATRSCRLRLCGTSEVCLCDVRPMIACPHLRRRR